MAGSYDHVVDSETGALLDNEDFTRMIENLGDAYEAVEELYGMVWYLATQLAEPPMNRVVVEAARRNYEMGLELAPRPD